MTSKPLFIMLAESMVTFAPMFQRGCFRAISLVAAAICSTVASRNGPPEAVSRIFSISALSPWSDWKMAECSESTGIMKLLCFLACPVTISPAATSVSLFARAMVFPERIAARVGFKPLNPTIEATTISMFVLYSRMSEIESLPANTFIMCGLRASETSL